MKQLQHIVLQIDMPPVHGTIAPLRRIRSIDFGILSSDEVIKNSVTTRDNELHVEKEGVFIIDSLTAKGGLNDPRLGPINKMDKCMTCNKSNEDCPGHFGHIHLHDNIFHVGFLDIM